MTATTLPVTTPLTTPWCDVIAKPVEQRDLQEAELARAASGGDRGAFSELLRRFQQPVFGLCYRLLSERDGAADATQESFVRAYAALASYDPEQRFDLWLLRIARNHCYDLLRRRGVRPQSDDEAAALAVDLAPTALDQLEEAETGRHLEAALQTLPAQDREVLALYYVQRKKTREIAGVMGVAPGTVMARLFRAREKLRKNLAEVAP
jgi:RNA polymerase sigma-70 factor, ECF subfamily